MGFNMRQLNALTGEPLFKTTLVRRPPPCDAFNLCQQIHTVTNNTEPLLTEKKNTYSEHVQLILGGINIC